MRVNDCEENPEFAFLESEMQEESFFYDPINDFALFSYVDVMTSEPLIVPLCGCDDQPDIDTYTEDELVAGDGQVLTITGSNFGVFNRGMPGEGGTGSSVLFTNADYQGTGDVTHPEFIAAGLRDFIIDDVLSWTDEEIQVKVPSTDWQTGIPGKAGSGRFIIRNGCNIEKQSGILQKLKIPYSLQNYRESNEGRALKLGLRQNNEGVNGDENGYHFKLTQELEDEAVLDIRQEFTNALSDWCNETSINFKLKEGVDAVNTYDNDDNRNSVTYFDSDTGGGAMITGILYYKITCGNPGEENDAGYIMTDIDFRINKASIDADADESLLRKILRHELGHAHQLGHALDKAGTPKPLMEPTINSNSSGTIQDDDSAGGNRVFATSAAIVEKGCYIGIPSNGVPVIPMSTGGCGETVEVKEVFSSGEIEVFPNPTQDEIIISAHSGLSSFEYEIYSIAGHRLLTGSCDNSNCLINIHELPKGTHTITITAENFLTTAKIVKL